ncbi:MAG: methionine--tRNA ligase [Chloroflexi bacterium]|nr:methionine--tRNA ligase [Chloroflexota bacterium]
MAERIFIGVAWPYANGPLHLGHVAGCYLPADIFARYHRLKGDQVLMVSGSDQHGTPITLRAEQEGSSPQQVVDKYHRSFLDCWERLGITFDLFTTTGTENHRQVVHDVFGKLHQQGYIYADTMPVAYCDRCGRFLPDRYVKGECPHCHNPDSRGDQCDRCGRTLDARDLVGPVCRRCGEPIHIRESEHLFLKLSHFQDKLLPWVEDHAHWRPNVLNFTRNYVREGLRDRAISRDIEWGVSIPLPGYEKKRVYVWFEAVIGYLSASREWAQRQGDAEAWRPFWQDQGTRAYYFIGKDNIPFHTIIWPAMLMGYGGLNLPYDVPANEFLTMEGRQLSTSRNWAVWLPDYLDRYAPDPLRYYMSAAMPESADADFSWGEYVRRNNDELVATYGNLAHRVLSMVHRNYSGRVPEPGSLGGQENALLEQARSAMEAVDANLAACHFREGMRVIMALAQEANRYLDARAPWHEVRQDRQAAATTLWTALSVLSALRVMTYPFMPFSAQRLHTMLGFDGRVEDSRWEMQRPQPGHPLPPPAPLFTKLEPTVVEEERQRMSTPAT